MVSAMAVLLLASGSHAGDIKGKMTVLGMKSAENIAVYVDTIPGKEFLAPAQSVLTDQKNLKFAPHVLVVLKGTTVDFLNSDPVGHNVYWPSHQWEQESGAQHGHVAAGAEETIPVQRPRRRTRSRSERQRKSADEYGGR